MCLFFLDQSCEFLRPLQNTKHLWSPKCTPKHTPNPLPKPKYRKITKKLPKPPIFVHFRIFFRILVSGGDSGCILGCIWALRGVLYSVWGRTNSQDQSSLGPQLPEPQQWKSFGPCLTLRIFSDYPKDPAVLKTLRDSELLRRSVFTTAPRFTTVWTPLWGAKCLQNPGKWCQHRGGVAIANHCVIVNLLCIVNLLRRSIFSTAGCFSEHL